MIYRKLGRTDINVSALSFGLWQLGDSKYWGERMTGAAAIRAAVDAGVNLFDTAESYGDGESERNFGKIIGADRDKILIATKIAPDHCGQGDVRRTCEASLARLNTDRIDLYQIHWPNHDVAFSETYAELGKLKDEGKIRAIGVSNFGIRDLEDWLSEGEAVSNQLSYNLLFRGIEKDVLPACKRHDVGVLTYSPLMQGILTGRWNTADEIPAPRRRTRHFSGNRESVKHGEQGHEEVTMTTITGLKSLSEESQIPMSDMATAWILAQPGITSVVIGSTDPEQVCRSVHAATVELPDDIKAKISEITRPLMEALGPNLDMWANQENSRIR